MEQKKKSTSGRMKKLLRGDGLTYFAVTAAFLVMTLLNQNGMLKRSVAGLLVPICCYMSLAVSLNLTVGILGELSLGHAGFMCVGAFSAVVVSGYFSELVPNPAFRLAAAMIAGAVCAAVIGVLVGMPVLKLHGDYLAIVTLAFGQIIKEVVGCLFVGYDSKGMHMVLNLRGGKTLEDLHLQEGGTAIIKGAQGAVGTETIATFTAGFVLVILTLVVVLNLMHSRHGRAIMALRDNLVAAESVGINTTRYKLKAFVLSAALAGAAGALYGLNYSSLQSAKFDFNTSILILVFVVLGGLGNIRGSLISAAALTVLPELLREFDQYWKLVYALVLIAVMLASNNQHVKATVDRLRSRFRLKKEAA